jgi:hypothetical protein
MSNFARLSADDAVAPFGALRLGRDPPSPGRRSIRLSSYDRATRPWLRICEQAGTTFFEAGPTPFGWTVLFSTESPTYMQQAEIDLGAATWGSHATPGRVELDHPGELP